MTSGAQETIRLRVEKLVAGGEALARYEGLPVFVARAAPGDLVTARVVKRKRHYLRAEVVEVLEPGAGRREPPCPHFADCGGCDLQHLDDDLQVELKAAATRETLERLGRFELPEAIEVRSGDSWGYRLRTGVRVESVESGHAVGYRARNSWRLVPVERCPVLEEALESEVLALGGRLPAEGAPERLDLAAGDGGRVTVAPVVEGLDHGEVTRAVGEFDYAFDARCFFQGHAGLVGELVAEVVGEGSGESAWDLYAGVGLFSLPLARRYGSVRAIEGDTIAARYARINARRNRVPNVEVLGGAVDSHWQALPERIDRVVLDPPRAGLSPEGVEALGRARPRQITYVSCHAAALARDLSALLATHRLEKLTLFDMFPQTGHMELVAQLVAGND